MNKNCSAGFFGRCGVLPREKLHVPQLVFDPRGTKNKKYFGQRVTLLSKVCEKLGTGTRPVPGA
jgi:hypothetical protein